VLDYKKPMLSEEYYENPAKSGYLRSVADKYLRELGLKVWTDKTHKN